MLFNTAVFNSRMFNGGTTIAEAYSADRLVFEDYSLSDGSVIVLTNLEDSGPTRDIVGDNVPMGDGMFITNDFFRERKIVARGYVKKSTAALLDAELDTIRKSLATREGNLDVTDNNSTAKRFVATLENYEELFADRQRYHLTICPFKASFVCKTPFGKARTYTSISLDTSTLETTQSVVNEGTYKAQPVVTLNFTAASSVTAVTLENETTGESITYTGSIAAGNVLVFDSENKQVTKAGAVQTFTGAFPTLLVGANLLTITVTGTSFTAYDTYKYRKTYL